MARDASLNIRTDSEIKALAEALYASFGLTLSDAVNMFLNVSVMEGRLPFELKQPRFNSATEAAIREAEDIAEGRREGRTFKNVEELFADLED